MSNSVKFMGNACSYDQARSVLCGIPLEQTVSFRPGTRRAPFQIRAVSSGLEEFSLDLCLDIASASFFDAGDLELPLGNLNGSLDTIFNLVDGFLRDNKRPFLIGGEHLITYPAVRAVAQRFPGLFVIHFDAHADLRDAYLGECLSHATVMRRVVELVGRSRVYQLGIRSGTAEEQDFAREHTFLCRDLSEGLADLLAQVGNRPVYITFDIDVVDPAFAPGTGTPEPGGCSSREVLEIIHALKPLNVVAFDLVEVCPPYDPAEQTAILAAKLLREALLMWS